MIGSTAGAWSRRLLVACWAASPAADAAPGHAVAGEGRIVEVGTGRALDVEQAGSVATPIRRAGIAMSRCVEVHRQRDPTAGGRVELAWTVREGRVVDVRVAADDTGDPGLSRCATGQLHRLRFPAGPELQIVWPFLFERGPGFEQIEVTIAPSRRSYVIGEPVRVAVTFENRGAATFTLTPPEQSRVERIAGVAVEAVGPDGAPVPDPFNIRPSGSRTGPSPSSKIAPGETATVSIDLNRYLWLDVPGTYHVRMRYPWPPSARDEPVSADDPGWRELTIEMRRPTEAEARALVATLPRTSDEEHRAPAATSYEGLGHALYVPILEPLARASLPTAPPQTERWSNDEPEPSGPDDRALHGLAACPCPEATEALLRLYDALDAPELRHLVSELLLRRIPQETPWADHPWLGPWVARAAWFSEQAWAPRFDGEARSRARAALGGPTQGERWREPYLWGAEVLQRIGTDDDVPALVAAVHRILQTPGTDERVVNDTERVVQQLAWALGRFEDVDTSGLDADTRRIVALLGWDGKDEPPAGWDAVIEDALSSRNPRVLALALRRVPPSSAATVRELVAEHVTSDDPWVVRSALRWVRDHPDPVFREPLLHVIRTADRSNLAMAWTAAGDAGVPLSQRMRLAVDVMGPDAPNADLYGLLMGVLTGCRSSAGGPIRPDQLPALKAAWSRFLDVHAAAIDAGQRWPIDGPASSPDLLPDGLRCTLEGGRSWP